VLFGAGLALALAVLAAGLALLAYTSPVTLLTVGRVTLVLLFLPAIGVLLVNLAALRKARYGVDRNAIVIRWGRAEQMIPLPEVDGILQGIGQSHVSRFRGLRWPGYWRGRGWISGLGSVHFYCATPANRHLIILTAAGAYAISPQDPNRFMDLYAAQRAMGPSETREQRLVQPRVMHRGLLSDPAAVLLFGLGGAINLLLAVILGSRYDSLPHTLTLHLDKAGLPDRVGGADQIFLLIILGAVAWLANGVLGAFIYSRMGERMAAYFLWGGAVLLQFLLWVALAGLI
jgi:hypothetical protein